MSAPQDAVARLRHDLANPLAAVLMETQLLLQQADRYDAETVASLQEIQAQARRMRNLLQSLSS